MSRRQTIAVLAAVLIGGLCFGPVFGVRNLWLPVGAALTIYGLRLGKAALLYQEHKHRAREGRLAE